MLVSAGNYLSQGYSCSQVMMMMSMHCLQMKDENIIKAMKGLSGGMGIRHACGIVTGAACAFSLAAPERGLTELFPLFYEQFHHTYGDDAGGINCIELLNGDFESHRQICPDMIEKSWDMAYSVLKSNGFCCEQIKRKSEDDAR